MPDCFAYDQKDALFYDQNIRDRLPKKLVDAHCHVNLPSHVGPLDPADIAGDWALQCGVELPAERAKSILRTLFPDARTNCLALPLPLEQANMAANNSYLAELFTRLGEPALMAVKPQWSPEQVEHDLLAGRFNGFKPYLSFARSIAPAQLRISDYLPETQLAIANRHSKVVLLHLPRPERLADDDNIRDLRMIVERYPDLRLVLAHLGRSFNVDFLREGLVKLGDAASRLYFDTAAVLNPEVYALAFEKLRPDQILFGTDMPFMLWHGRRRWTERTYINLCREDFPWNRHLEPELETDYTLFIYEQVKVILDVTGQAGTDRDRLRTAVFSGNAEKVYRFSTERSGPDASR